MAGSFYYGKRFSYDGNLCTVRYVGEVNNTKGQWVGVEWDDPTRGKHSGEYNGVKYFECIRKHPTAGSFIRPTRPSDARLSFIKALHKKYASESHTHINGTGDAPIKISGKEVEEVGFEKVRRQLANLHELRIVLLDGLCVWHPDNLRQGDTVEPRWTPTSTPEHNTIAQLCPNIVELDLSRNLFEKWSEVADICRQLNKLKLLRLNGNRFRLLDMENGADTSTCLSAVTEFSLDDTLIPWAAISDLTRTWLPELVTFSASNNDFMRLSSGGHSSNPLPFTIKSLTLESNGFTSLEDLAPLATLPNLQRLSLRSNLIRSIGRDHGDLTHTVFPQSLSDVDLSFNAIDSWAVIDGLQDVFPGLSVLRVSHNPLYRDLRWSDNRLLSSDNGYMLTLARIGRLQTLNFSPITPKERLDAEAYYLSQIAGELSRHPLNMASNIIARHRRYAELCQEYGEPVIQRADSSTNNPNSLAARLVLCNLRLATSAQKAAHEHLSSCVTREIPRSCNVYTVLGIAGKAFGLSPMKLKLIWETGEWDPAPRNVTDDFLSEASSSEDSCSDVEENRPSYLGPKEEHRVLREIELVAGTRPIGMWIEGSAANIRVEMR